MKKRKGKDGEKWNEIIKHNGRSEKNGAYNVKYDGRRFDIKKSEHIDAEMTKRNIYYIRP